MFKCYKGSVLVVIAQVLNLIVIAPAHAYLGPGGAVSGFGALLALIGAVVVAIVGFLWFPIKRMLMKKKKVNIDEPVVTDSELVRSNEKPNELVNKDKSE